MSGLVPGAVPREVEDDEALARVLQESLDEDPDEFTQSTAYSDNEIQQLDGSANSKPSQDNRSSDLVFPGSSQGFRGGNEDSESGPSSSGGRGEEAHGAGLFADIFPQELSSTEGSVSGSESGEQLRQSSTNGGFNEGGFLNLPDLPTSSPSPQESSVSSSPGLLSPSTTTRKRLQDHYPSYDGSGRHPEAKSRRTTPSPAVTGRTSPSTPVSIGIPDEEFEEIMRAIAGDSPGSARKFREEQMESERIMRERMQRERQDAEFARALQADSPYFGSLSAPTSSMVAHGSQTTRGQVDNGLTRLAHLPKREPNFPGSSHGDHNTGIGKVKAERSSFQQPQHSDRSSNGFIELSSDEDFQEITPVAFQKTGGANRQQSQPTPQAIPGNRSLQLNPTGHDRGRSPFIRIDDFDDALSPGNDKHSIQGTHSAPLNPYGPSPTGALPASAYNAQRGPAFSGYGPNGNGGHSPNYHNDPQRMGLSGHAMGYPYAHPYSTQPNMGNASDAQYIPGAGVWAKGVDAASRFARNAASTGRDMYYGLNGFVDYAAKPNGLQVHGRAAGIGGPSTPWDIPAGAFNSSYRELKSDRETSHASDPLGLGIDLDTNAYQAYLDRYDYIANDPTKTREEIQALLENIRPDEEMPPENREGTPDGMKYPLMEHQKLGLTWLKNMEEGSNRGGILADDMGLGKTIQALALILSRPSDDRRCKTTLIVGPVALMKQWEREIQTKITGRGLSTFLLHGAKKNTATWSSLKEFDVVLTTYGTLASELKRKEAWHKRRRENPDAIPAKGEKLLLVGGECKWYRVILDEAQCIKNKSTKAALGACALQSQFRLCMTGTPMMNNVGELFSLIEFLRIKPYNEQTRFNLDFGRPLKNGSQAGKEKAMRKLQALLKAILLRRTKKSQIDGKPILNLLERTTEVRNAVFSEDEQEFYRALESKTQLQFNKYMKAGTVNRNYSNILVLLLRLRQACCHPHLIRDFGIAVNAEVSMDDMVSLAKELAPEVVSRIKEIESFECQVCYDAVDNPTIFIPCGHDTCSECFARISDPTQALAQGNDDFVAKCPSCRGKIEPKKVIEYNVFKQVHMPDPTTEAKQADVEEDADSETESEDDDTDESDTSSLDGFIVDDDETGNEGYGEGSDPFSKSKKSTRKKKDVKGKGKAKEAKGPTKSLAQLKREGARNAKARRKYMRRLARDWVSSAKVDKACEILEKIEEAEVPEKTIVFSQFTSLLDLIEVPISRKGWGYRRYDGGMSATARNQAVLDFTDQPNCKIMLVSLKAGNAGLNLVAASQVIILDPFWNPYIEEQAIDRAHRIGQLKPVRVHRILVENTVEDRIINLQEQKRQLIEGALDEKASQNIGRLGIRELAYLFVRHPQTTWPIPTRPTTPRAAPVQPTEEEIASSVLSALFTAEKPGKDLECRLQDIVHTSGWYEGVAKRILAGLELALNEGAAMGGAMKEAFDKATAVADGFVREHPILVGAVVTLVAIGILVNLVPWAVEALGFAELGPVEGSFAALWQSTFPDVEAASWFAWFQRLGMKWAAK
ncbi:MAG: hypothetical protein M1819_002369 [Sarea resinae]|nr:MAG: hypothetical protein M1819_002369 [Sarea resinae]